MVTALEAAGLDARRTGGTNEYPDVLVSGDPSFYVEGKGERAQFGSPRLTYDGTNWVPASSHGTGTKRSLSWRLASYIDGLPETRDFLAEMRKFLGRRRVVLVRSERVGGYAGPETVTPRELSRFLKKVNRNNNIVKRRQDLAPFVRAHYVHGKKVVAPYLQWGNNFFRLVEDDPLELSHVPLLKSVEGELRVSIMFASDRRYYAVVPRLEPDYGTVHSPYDVNAIYYPEGGKIFPFEIVDDSAYARLIEGRATRG